MTVTIHTSLVTESLQCLEGKCALKLWNQKSQELKPWFSHLLARWPEVYCLLLWVSVSTSVKRIHQH